MSILPDCQSGLNGGELERALQLLDAGFSVLPIQLNGTKAPACTAWKQFQKRAMMPDEARSLWSNRAGIAVIGGSVSGGLEVIDFDVEAETVYPQWRALVEEEAPGLLAKCSIARTPRPGVHARFRSWKTEGNQKLAMPANGRGKPLIETRGEGGYVLVEGNPPEAHETGRCYELLEGPPLEELGLIREDEREVLIRSARALNRHRPDDKVCKAGNMAGFDASMYSDSIRPGDAYNAEMHPAAILAARKWTRVREFDGLVFWRRPDKKVGWSATTGLTSKKGSRLCRIFTESAGIPSGTYDAFGLYAAFEHNGDLSKAASELSRQGYGGPPKFDEGPAKQESATDDVEAEGAPEDAAEASSDDSPPPKPRDPRTQILIGLDEKADNDKIIQVLSSHKSIYQQAARLVTVVRASAPKGNAVIRREEGSPMTFDLVSVRLREIMTEVATFWAWKKVGGEMKPVRVPPPGCAPSQIIARRQWDHFSHLEGIVETPNFLADGRILQTPGWDEDSGLLYIPSGEFHPVADKPSKADAIRSAAALLELVRDFPFSHMHHKAAWLSALLTAFSRFAFRGPTPLFLYDANVAGSGKSFLCDIIAIIATGRPMSRVTWPNDDDEVRKTLLSLAIGGDRFCLWDNIGEGCVLGGPAMDNALTSERYKGRILGLSEIIEVPFTLQQFSTGNNVVLFGDTERRTIHIRLNSPLEKPEERADFKVPNLRLHIKERRPELITHVLTILRAFDLAGRPLGSDLIPFGSFEGWSDLVRGAVIWATEGADPCAGRDELKKANLGKAFLAAFLEHWETLPCGSMGLTVADALNYLNGPGFEYQAFRNLIVANLRKGELNTRSLGAILRDNRDRVTNGRKIAQAGEYQGAALWKVERVGE
jgi:hypothetical protein